MQYRPDASVQTDFPHMQVSLLFFVPDVSLQTGPLKQMQSIVPKELCAPHNVSVSLVLVVIACWAKHRKQSIGAVEYILEELKHNAPLWKKEFYKDNTSRWVENNT